MGSRVSRPSSANALHAALIVAALAAALAAVSSLGTQSAQASDPVQKVEQQLLDELSGGEPAAFWVYLGEQADLSSAPAIADRAAQGEFVYERLRAAAHRSQAGLLAMLRAKGVAHESFWIANTVKVTGDRELLDEIAARPEVAEVTADRVYELPEPIPAEAPPRIQTVEWGLDRIKAPDVWEQFGTRGAGIVVGAIDTGALHTHPALVEQYRGNLGNGQFDHNYNWHDPSNVCGNPSTAPCDNNGHGTHVTGTMVGDDSGDNQIGVAPHAKWIAAKGCETTTCSQAALLSSGQFILAPTDLRNENPDPSKRPHIVNNSWGGGATTDPWYRPTVEAWVAAGIFPQFANGNNIPGCTASSNPGNLPESYSAGAFDINNAIAGFSNRGPSAWDANLIKPNIAAPGVAIRSAWNNGAYNTISGTSMASPHVSGSVALLWSLSPLLERDIAATRALLDQTAIDVEDLSCGGTAENNNVWGEGRLDVLAVANQAPVGPTGSLQGTVTDGESGGPISGATVRAAGPIMRTVTTDAAGRYSIPVLSVGGYDVSFSAFGYGPNTVAGVVVDEGQTTTLDATLVTPKDWGKVAGAVTETDCQGNTAPLQGVQVQAAGKSFSISMSSDAQGTYAFWASQTVGQLTISASKDGWISQTVSKVKIKKGETTTVNLNLHIQLPCAAWIARYDGPAGGSDAALAQRVSPDGSRVYVTGRSTGAGTSNDYATLAYDADSGAELWIARYDGPAGGSDVAWALDVSPDGSRVFVTGQSGVGTPADYATVAYDAATGEQLWVARYDGPGSSTDVARALSVSPDGSQVFVTGDSVGTGTGIDYATVAYDAATGEQLWVARYNGPANGGDFATDLGVSPGGSRVFVTGRSPGVGTGSDYATVAYDAVTGEERWIARYNGPGDGARATDQAGALGVSPDGLRVFVTGRSSGVGGDLADYATVAYGASSGEELWVARYNGPAGGTDVARALRVSPDGSQVFVTGDGPGSGTGTDYATVAHDATTGQELWVARYDGPASGGDFATDLDVTADGSRVFVTGQSAGLGTGLADYATVAYEAGTGEELWAARYNGPGGDLDAAEALGVSPDGSRVFVTGQSTGVGTGTDYATVAYSTFRGAWAPNR